jgi:hypothetical protein
MRSIGCASSGDAPPPPPPLAPTNSSSSSEEEKSDGGRPPKRWNPPPPSPRAAEAAVELPRVAGVDAKRAPSAKHTASRTSWLHTRKESRDVPVNFP